jgi:UDP-glucose 4-epimerase
MEMSILLTGSAGFLGRNLYLKLKENNYKVIGLDVENSPTTDIKFDFRSPMLAHFLSNKAIELIVHVGAIADVYHAAKDPKMAYEVNIMGTQNLVNICHGLNIPMVYTSTWEVYGEPKYQPIDEEHPTIPDHPYNISKLSGELVVRNKLMPINFCILRLGTLYGPDMRESAVIPKFINMALNGQDITIFGTGEQFRQFTHIEDVCRAFEMEIKGEARGVYNVVSGEKNFHQRFGRRFKTLFSRFKYHLQRRETRRCL